MSKIELEELQKFSIHKFQKTSLKKVFCFLEKCRWNFYKEKKLNLDIPVLLEDFEKLKRLKPNEILNLSPGFPKRLQPRVESNPNQVSFTTLKTTSPPVATLKKFNDAIKLCDAMGPECRGFTVDDMEVYTLKGGRVPKSVSLPYDDVNNINQTDHARPVRGSYIKYCPGTTGHVQRYNSTLTVAAENQSVKGSHSYKFVVEMAVSTELFILSYFFALPLFT